MAATSTAGVHTGTLERLGKGPAMSEIVLFLESAMSASPVILFALFVVAAGLMVFDRGERTPKTTTTDSSRSRDSMAA